MNTRAEQQLCKEYKRLVSALKKTKDDHKVEWVQANSAALLTYTEQYNYIYAEIHRNTVTTVFDVLVRLMNDVNKSKTIVALQILSLHLEGVEMDKVLAVARIYHQGRREGEHFEAISRFMAQWMAISGVRLEMTKDLFAVAEFLSDDAFITFCRQYQRALNVPPIALGAAQGLTLFNNKKNADEVIEPNRKHKHHH